MSTTGHIRERAIARLRAAMTYWIATTRPDGRPHSMPVWGVWVDGALWFGTGGQKIRNLAHQPWAVAHLESGEDVAIIEGPVERLPFDDAPPAVAAAYGAKYVDPRRASRSGSWVMGSFRGTPRSTCSVRASAMPGSRGPSWRRRRAGPSRTARSARRGLTAHRPHA